MPYVKTQDGSIKYIPDAEIAGNLKAGQWFEGWQDPKNAPTVDMVNDRGRVVGVSMTPQNIAKYSQAGYSFESKEVEDQKLHNFEMQKKYGGRYLEAGVAGALRGATFGLSDQVYKMLGGDVETLAGLKEANPTLSTVSEIGGAIAPAIVSGGGSAAAKGALLAGEKAAGKGVLSMLSEGARFAPSSFASRTAQAIGQAGEGLAVRAAEAGAGKLAQGAIRLAPKILGGAVEGAAYGAGAAVSDNALYDEPLLGEHALQQVGMGALLGGATILGGESVSSGLKWAKSKLPEGMSIGDLYVNAVAKMKGGKTAKEDLGMLIGSGKKQQINRAVHSMDPEALTNAASESIHTLESDAMKYADTAFESGMGKGKLESIKHVIGDQKLDVGSMYSSADDVLKSARDRIETIYRDPNYGFRIQNKKALSTLESARKDIAKIAESGDSDSAAMIFDRMDSAKRDIGKLRSSMKYTRNASTADQEALKELESVYKGTLKPHLEDSAIYGRAADAQQSVNPAWERYLGNEAFQESFTKKVGEKDWAAIYEPDPSKIRGVIGNIGQPENIEKLRFYAEHLDARLEVLNRMEKAFDLRGNVNVPKARLDAIDRLREITTKQKNMIDFVTNAKNVREAFGRITKSEGTANGMIGAMFGYALGGAPGAAIGGIASKQVGHALSPILNWGPERIIQMSKKSPLVDAMMKHSIDAQKMVAGGISKETLIAGSRKVTEATTKLADEFKRIQNAGALGVESRNAILKSTSELNSRVKSTVDSFTRKVVIPAAVISSHKDDHVSQNISRAIKSNDNKEIQKTYFAALSDLRKAHETQTIHEHVANMTSDLMYDHPEAGFSAQVTAHRVSQYLMDKAPKGVSGKDAVQIMQNRKDDLPVIATTAVKEWFSLYRLLDKPTTILDRVAAGTVSSKDVDAVKTCYPKMYEDMVGKTIEHLSKVKEPIPYNQRQRINTFLGVQDFETVVALQQTYGPAQEAAFAHGMQGPQPKQGKVKIKNLSSIASAPERVQRERTG